MATPSSNGLPFHNGSRSAGLDLIQMKLPGA
jgi:hypothetical protein